MTAGRDSGNRRAAPWPSVDEQAEVERFGLDRPETIQDRLSDAYDRAQETGREFIAEHQVEDTRSGFVILGVIAFLVIGLLVVAGLAAYGVTHP